MRGSSAVADSMFLLSSILQYGPVFESPVVEVKRHAPAATPHAAVLLDQPIKIRPGSFVQRLGVEAIHEMLENRMSLRLAPTPRSPVDKAAAHGYGSSTSSPFFIFPKRVESPKAK
jgi:hypothetical protein